MTRLQITRAEVRELLRANIGKQLRITFDTGEVHWVEIGAVDDEGFLHGGPGLEQPGLVWKRFEQVKHIERKLPPYAASNTGDSTAAPNWVTPVRKVISESSSDPSDRRKPRAS